MSVAAITIERSQTGVLIAIIGYALLAVLGARLSLLGIRVRQQSGRPQATLWMYFAFVGIVGILIGGVGISEELIGLGWYLVEPLLFAFALLIALTMREAYYNTAFSNREVDRLGEFRLRRLVELGFVLVVPVTVLGAWITTSSVWSVLLGIGALGVAVYGVYYQRQRTGDLATRGTMIDTLLRQSLPALLFATGQILIQSLEYGVFGPVIVDVIGSVFLLLIGASLLPITVKLNQYLLTKA